ncbi:MAG: DNA polymerase III subunit gamma/tau [Chloroflexi bacterium]|nr:DNA polymerase III subunit gamma/tau [Chloroflexota bacterium]
MIPSVPHRALYRIWRAQTFAGIVGQDAAVGAIRNAVRTGRLAHGLLFVGPRGTGKTSMARIVAKALNCTDLRDGEPCDRCVACVAIRDGTALDVAELDAASNNRVDDMRELLSRTATAPSDLRRKVFIIDEVQRIREGWDVLLKTLEEPPDHVAFIFCTTDASGIRPAVLSRVQRFDFRRLTVPQIAGKLRRILESSDRESDEDAVDLIARLAAGGMRDAESMLDQLLTGGDDRLTADRVRDLLGLAAEDTVRHFVDALLTPDPLAGMTVLDELEEHGRDPRVFLDQVLESIRALLVAGLDAGATSGDRSPRRLASIGRRLAAIDPARVGPGGLRFQLDLALLERIDRDPPSAPGVPPPAVEVPSVPAEVLAAPRPPRPSGPRPSGSPGVRSATAVPPVPSATPTPTPTPTPNALAVPADTTTLADPSLAMLLARWPEIVADLSAQPAVKPLITACRPIAVEGRIVTLGFPEHQAFLRSALERRRATVEEGIAARTGGPVSVRFVATNVEIAPAVSVDADADRLIAEARRIFADDLADVGEVN